MAASVVLWPAVASAQLQSQADFVRAAQASNGIAREYARTVGDTDYLARLSPDVYFLLDARLIQNSGYVLYPAGTMAAGVDASLNRFGGSVYVPGPTFGDVSFSLFGAGTQSYILSDAQQTKEGLQVSDFLGGIGVGYKDLVLLHVGAFQQGEQTVFENGALVAQIEAVQKPFASFLSPRWSVAVNTLPSESFKEYFNAQVSRLGRFVGIEDSWVNFSQVNNIVAGFTHIGIADQNNLFLRGHRLLRYLELGVELDVAEPGLRAIVGGGYYTKEWTRFFLELGGVASVYRDRRLHDLIRQRNVAQMRTDDPDGLVGGFRASASFGLRRDYLYGPRDLSWWDYVIPARIAVEYQLNDKDTLQDFFMAFESQTAVASMVWDAEPRQPKARPTDRP